MGLRVLYLTDLASAFNEEAFRGMKLAGKLAGDGEILVRHWLTDSREEAIARNAGLAADATDRAEFEALAPDFVFLEGGLYWNRDGDWRVPPDLAVSFVEKGGVFIVADVDRNERLSTTAHTQAIFDSLGRLWTATRRRERRSGTSTTAPPTTGTPRMSCARGQRTTGTGPRRPTKGSIGCLP
jgi:hypothetical protein